MDTSALHARSTRLRYAGTSQLSESVELRKRELLVTYAGANTAPAAVCQNVFKSADSMCQASVSASEVNNESTDPDDDPLTFSLFLSGPFRQL